VTNVFYLINVILQYQPSISTNSPLASLVPLVFVIFIGMLKELIADVKRWREDMKTNKMLYKRVHTQGQIDSVQYVKSESLKVGDILELTNDLIVPADCLLLHTVEKMGECFI